jgi:hypothetical protein
VKEACWAISNILAGDNQQIQSVLDYDDGKIIDKLLKIARECQDTDVCHFPYTYPQGSKGDCFLLD